MALVPTFRNVSTIIGEDGTERVIDFQLIECSLVLPPPVETPPESELPSSVCPMCGDLDVNISDGLMICNECGSQATFGMTVEAEDLSDVIAQLGQIENDPNLTITTTFDFEGLADFNVSNPCGEIKKEIYPIKKYEDIVGNIRNRFDILDL